jgi:3-hydroxymyristoyl/3-hydroxydecanoyl-(acyl carrier protein) dehydratase
MTEPVLLPQILEKKIFENSAQLVLRIPENLLYLDGHFPQMPIVAGVVQLHWAIQFARDIFSLTDLIENASQIKFNNLIRPQDKVTLTLTVNPETQNLIYTYKLGEKICSSGRFALIKK